MRALADHPAIGGNCTDVKKENLPLIKLVALTEKADNKFSRKSGGYYCCGNNSGRCLQKQKPRPGKLSGNVLIIPTWGISSVPAKPSVTEIKRRYAV